MTDKLWLLPADVAGTLINALGLGIQFAERAPNSYTAEGIAELKTMKENLKTGFFKPEYTDIVPFFAAPADDPAVASAREHYANDDLEIDDRAILSVGDTGTWVSAWVFIPRSELPDETDD